MIEPQPVPAVVVVSIDKAQLDRIESKVDQMLPRVSQLERRSSAWGAFGGLAVAIISHLAGCL